MSVFVPKQIFYLYVVSKYENENNNKKLFFSRQGRTKNLSALCFRLNVVAQFLRRFEIARNFRIFQSSPSHHTHLQIHKLLKTFAIVFFVNFH